MSADADTAWDEFFTARKRLLSRAALCMSSEFTEDPSTHEMRELQARADNAYDDALIEACLELTSAALKVSITPTQGDE